MGQSQVLQNSKTDLLSTQSLTFNGRRITDAGNAQAPQDYITLGQVQSLISAAIPTTTTNRTQININGVVKAGQPGAILYVGGQGQLSQDSTNFRYAGNGELDLTNIVISSLTLDRPVRVDPTTKKLIVGPVKISLAAEVTGSLRVVNGGTQLATLTAFAVLLGNGTGAVGFSTVGTSGRVLTDNGAGANPTFQVPAVISVFGRTGVVVLTSGDFPNFGPGAGSYTVGLKLTGGGVNGTITLDAQGRITAIQQAT